MGSSLFSLADLPSTRVFALFGSSAMVQMRRRGKDYIDGRDGNDCDGCSLWSWPRISPLQTFADLSLKGRSSSRRGHSQGLGFGSARASRRWLA